MYEGLSCNNFAETDAFKKPEGKNVISLGRNYSRHGFSKGNILQAMPERVITSRMMIRRKKPTPGVGSFKFKNRRSLHGHQDLDFGSSEVFSPMPRTESITLFFQISLGRGLTP